MGSVMPIRPAIAVLAGALATGAMAIASAARSDQDLAQRLSDKAGHAISQEGGRGVTARFTNRFGWPTRHPLLSGGEKLNEGLRDQVAKSIAAIPGVGGISWADGSNMAMVGEQLLSPLHCQDDVDALLRARTIRFEESSSRIDAASRELLDEVAQALRPCLGSIISITGHTDSSGPEPGNLALSKERAQAVQQALIARGIPADGLRADGVGSSHPVDGLLSNDPANRRIEFKVVATQPLNPTPVDIPGPR